MKLAADFSDRALILRLPVLVSAIRAKCANAASDPNRKFIA
jgi:hypothetical protein